ncbi:exodeoxyribonuclease VII small subunit [Neptunicella sp. SCSIO 80796]|uniref:exodeoxyribonuclease VII small subunit n=1 Tax=Neptunicella plasticusilytica TaxID=3117012 RepID=UPI003A4DEED7
MTSNKKTENLSFEQSLQELESIVTQMEQGDLELDLALQQFERGIMLARNSQTKLSEAEQKVKILMQQQGQEKLIDFEQDDQGE